MKSIILLVLELLDLINLKVIFLEKKVANLINIEERRFFEIVVVCVLLCFFLSIIKKEDEINGEIDDINKKKTYSQYFTMFVWLGIYFSIIRIFTKEEFSFVIYHYTFSIIIFSIFTIIVFITTIYFLFLEIKEVIKSKYFKRMIGFGLCTISFFVMYNHFQEVLSKFLKNIIEKL